MSEPRIKFKAQGYAYTIEDGEACGLTLLPDRFDESKSRFQAGLGEWAVSLDGRLEEVAEVCSRILRAIEAKAEYGKQRTLSGAILQARHDVATAILELIEGTEPEL